MLKQSTLEKIKTSRRVKLLIVFVMILLIVFMFPKGESIESEVNVGSIWIQNDLIASLTFQVLKDDSTLNRERQEATAKIYPIFTKNVNLPDAVSDSINRYSMVLIGATSGVMYQNLTDVKNNTILSDQTFLEFLKLRQRSAILSEGESPTLERVLNNCAGIIDLVYAVGVMNINYEDIDQDSISVREGKFERAEPKIKYFDQKKLREYIQNNLAKTYNSVELRDAMNEYIAIFLKPNIIYSTQLTEEARNMARDRVPKNIGIVNENERIVAKHDRITKEIKAKIDSYRIAKGEEIGFWGRSLQGLGKFLHIIIITLLFIIYIYLFRKRIYNNNVKILLIALIILIIGFIAFLVQQIDVDAPVEFLIFVPVASMLLTILFDSRVGFYGTIVVALIAGGLRGNDYVFTAMNIFAGALAAYTVRDIKNRNQIFRSFLFILSGYILGIIAFGLERFAPIESLLISSAFASSNALISPVLTYGLIIFFERAFRITTDLTLLELTDFNRPLMKELARNAPGTFNHCMTIGSMVETASEAIGANPTLARVGAYYHDIGKTIEPEGFIENQLNNQNIHAGLSPKESARIIISHVTGGIALAKQNKLPQEVIDFIPMHHGTMAVTFFYEKAKEIYGADKVDINDYRYPGPKPNTKETALLMLADACESTVRSMTEPDIKKVENVINNLIKMRMDDGQLDEAPLTLADIKKIKSLFMSILIGQHHKRIRYPNQDKIEQSGDEAKQ